jgi:hypothetical protein
MALKDRRKTQPAQHPEKDRLLSLEIILPLLTYKAFIFGFIFLSLTLLPPLFNFNGYNKNFHWPSDAPPSLETMFASWDAQMHLQLSHDGYDKNLMSVNHQPLYRHCIPAVPRYSKDVLQHATGLLAVACRRGPVFDANYFSHSPRQLSLGRIVDAVGRRGVCWQSGSSETGLQISVFLMRIDPKSKQTMLSSLDPQGYRLIG